jgi:aminoglycoside phosphotransferase (APT) family kinase protein
MTSDAQPVGHAPTSRPLFLVFDFGGVITANAFPAMQEYSLDLFDRVLAGFLRNVGEAPAVLVQQVAGAMRPFLRAYFSAVNKYDAFLADDGEASFYKLEMGKVDRREYCRRFQLIAPKCIDGLYLPRAETKLREIFPEASVAQGVTIAKELLTKFNDAFDIDVLMSILERSPLRRNVIELLDFVRHSTIDASGAKNVSPVRFGLITNNWKGMNVDEGIHQAFVHANQATRDSPSTNAKMDPRALFDAVVESHKCSARKPHPSLFRLMDSQLRGTLPSPLRNSQVDFTFFDDLAPNIQGASQSLVVHSTVRVFSARSVYLGVVDALRRVNNAALASACEARFDAHFPTTAVEDSAEGTVNALPLPAPPVANLLPSDEIPEKQRFSDTELAVLLGYLSCAAPNYFPMRLKLMAEGGKPIVEYFKGGMSNPTFRITLRTGSFVLRKQPKGKLLKGAHDIRREYAIMQHLNVRGDVPVPHCILYCDDPSILGTPFYVMKFVPGSVIRNATTLLKAPNSDKIVYGMMDALAALHKSGIPAALAPKATAPASMQVHAVLKTVRTWGAQYDRANLQLAAASDKNPQVERSFDVAELVELGAKLTAILSRNDGFMPRLPPTLVHGDYKIDNMIIDGLFSDTPRIAALLDFELAQVSDPLADLGYFCTMYVLPPPRGIAGTDSSKVPTFEQAVKRYCSQAGVLSELSDEERVRIVRVYMAAACHKLGGIIHGVVVRAMLGNASDISGGLKLRDLCTGVSMIGLTLIEDIGAPAAQRAKL